MAASGAPKLSAERFRRRGVNALGRDDNAVLVTRLSRGHDPIEDIFQHRFWRAQQRIAVAAAARAVGNQPVARLGLAVRNFGWQFDRALRPWSAE